MRSGARGSPHVLQESLRVGETDNMNNPLFLHPRGARSIKTPRMQARESKSQRSSTRAQLWISSPQTSAGGGHADGVPRLPLNRLRAEMKVLHRVHCERLFGVHA